MTPQQPAMPTGIPAWLEQFLNSQGGMQGLLYQVGGMRGLLDLIQQQSQPRQPSGPPAWRPPGDLAGRVANPQQWGQWAGQTGHPGPSSMPFGWDDWMTKNHPVPEWQPGKTFQGRLVIGENPDPQPGDITYLTQKRADAAGLSPYITQGLPQQSNVAGWDHTLSLAEIAQFRAARGLRGDEMLAAIPERFRNTPEAQQMARLGRNPEASGFYLDPRVMFPGVRGGGELKPEPMRKSDFAAQYGYESGGIPYRGQEWSTDAGMGGRDRRYQTFGTPYGQIQQTLKSAGWKPGDWGPQEWTRPEGQAPFTDQQQIMLNDLLYSITPNRDTSNNWFGTGMSAEEYRNREPRLPAAPDPFEGLQSAINRDAYVNDTLGGGFYGGLIPEQDAINTWGANNKGVGNRKIGGAHDPHFATPQLALNPLPGESKYDTYAGWASDQGAAFGQAPWASDSQWGQAQGFDDPRRYRQPPAPATAWQPTPQFGTNNWGGTQGWGNTSRNGTQNQNNNAWGNNTQQQQQPMSFGTSPWDNPWGMR